MADWFAGVLSVLVFAAYPASVVAWYRLWSRRSSHGRLTDPLLPAVSRPAPFWSLADVILMVGVFFIATGLATGLGHRQGWLPSAPPTESEPAETSAPPVPLPEDESPEEESPKDGSPENGSPESLTPEDESAEDQAADTSRGEDAASEDDLTDDGTVDSVGEDATDGSDDASPYSFAAIVLHSLSSLVVTAVMLAILVPRRRRAMHELGLVPRRGDVRLGALAALLILPPVTVVMQLSTWWISYEHPVLEQLQSAPGWPVVLALFVSSVVIAPLTEEFVFRGLLQGALQRLADLPEPDQTDWVPRAAWPVVLTSFLFAMMHFGQGPAPIPLFVLSLGLGYLYRQTGSLIPPILVHMILNGVTMTVTISELLR